MSLVQRLIVFHWFKAFFAACFALFLLVSISNIVSELLRAVAPFSDILKNYLLEIPKWMNKILPVCCLMGGLFSLTKLQNQGELIAIISIGTSRNKLLSALMVGPFIIAMAQFWMGGYLRPYTKSIRSSFLEGQEIHFRGNKSVGVMTSSLTGGKIWYKGQDYFNSFSAYDKNRQEFLEVELIYVDSAKGHITQVVWAKKASFMNQTHWEFKDGLDISQITEQGHPISKKFEKLVLALNVRPSDFDKINSDVETLNFMDLKKYIDKIERLGINSNEYLVYYYQVIADTLMCFSFAFLGINAIYRPNRRSASVAKNLLFAFVFTLFYWFLYSALVSLGSNGKIPPIIATNTCSILGLFVGFFTYIRNRKLRN